MPPLTVRVYVIFDMEKFNKKKGTHRVGSCQSVLDLPLQACEEFTSTTINNGFCGRSKASGVLVSLNNFWTLGIIFSIIDSLMAEAGPRR